MKKIIVRIILMVLLVFTASSAHAADPGLVEKAKAEGQAAFYANITAIEPIMEAFNRTYGLAGTYTRISTRSFSPPC